MSRSLRFRRQRDFEWLVKAESISDSQMMARKKKTVQRETSYLTIQKIRQLDNQKSVNFYGSVVHAEQSSDNIWNLLVADRTGVIRCTCHEGTIKDGMTKSIPFEKGLFLRVHQAEILNDDRDNTPDNTQLRIKIGEAGCQIVLWDQFSHDANIALFFSSKRFTRNQETDQEMLQLNLTIIAEYIVNTAMEKSLPFRKTTMSDDLEVLKKSKWGQVFYSSNFYEVSPGYEQQIEYYTKCDCVERKDLHIRVTDDQADIACVSCGKNLKAGIQKTRNVKIKTSPDVNLYFVLPDESTPNDVLICPSRATIIGISHDLKFYELYLETIEHCPLAPTT